MKWFLTFLLTILSLKDALAGYVVDLVNGYNVSFGHIDVQIRIGDLEHIEDPVVPEDFRLRTIKVVDEKEVIDLFTGAFRTHQPLDPLSYNKKIVTPLKNTEMFLDGTLTFSKLVIHGLRDFVIDKIRIDGLRTDFSFSVPFITANVNIRAKLQVLGFIHMTFFGQVTAHLENFHVDDSLRFDVVHGVHKDVYQLAALHANVSVDNLVLSTKNIKLDPYEQMVDNFVSTLKPATIQSIKNELEEAAGNFILSTVNSLLMSYSVNEVLNYN